MVSTGEKDEDGMPCFKVVGRRKQIEETQT